MEQDDKLLFNESDKTEFFKRSDLAGDETQDEEQEEM
jgi:hypothetical protein